MEVNVVRSTQSVANLSQDLIMEQSILSINNNLFLTRGYETQKYSFNRVQKDISVGLSTCMNFVHKHRRPQPVVTDWIHDLFKALLETAPEEQYGTLLNGYANLYQMNIYCIPYDNRGLIDRSKIIEYTGNLKIRNQIKNYSDITFIINDARSRTFTPLFINNENGLPQTCFELNDLVINHMFRFFEEHNRNIVVGEARPQWNLPFSGAVENFTEHETTIGPSVRMNQQLYDVDLLQTVNSNIDQMKKLVDKAKHLNCELEHTSEIESVNRRVSTIENSQSKALILLDTTPGTNSLTSTLQESYSYEAPNILKQPRRYRQVRMLSDVARDDCYFVQAGKDRKQRKYIEIEISVFTDEEMKDLYLSVRAVTAAHNLKHPLKCVLPPDVTADLSLMVNGDERRCLQFDPLTFDLENERAFLEITDHDRRMRHKTINIRLFNWKKFSSAKTETIEMESLQFCRLAFQFCRRSSANEYEALSPCSFTDIIEDTKSDLVIDPSSVTPKELCERGGEKITVPLNVSCRKKDLAIECQESKLPQKNYQVIKKKLSITTPPKLPESDELHLVISKKTFDESDQKESVSVVYDEYLKYVEHGAYEHHCPRSVSVAVQPAK